MKRTSARDRLPTRRASDPNNDTIFRDDFVRVLAGIGLGQEDAAVLVESRTGLPFSACARAHFVPILGDLLAIALRTATRSGTRSCGD
jgi:hypothetical protein